MTTKQAFFNHLVKLQAIRYGKFKLKSGLESSIYCDMRTAVLNADALSLAVECLNELLLEYNYNSVGVVEGAGSGVLFGGLLHYIGDISGFIIRKETKPHGTKQIIEGTIGSRPVLLDDVATTGSSLVYAIKHMPQPPLVVAVLVDRQEGAAKAISPFGVKLVSVFTLAEIIEILAKKQSTI